MFYPRKPVVGLVLGFERGDRQRLLDAWGGVGATGAMMSTMVLMTTMVEVMVMILGKMAAKIVMIRMDW